MKEMKEMEKRAEGEGEADQEPTQIEGKAATEKEKKESGKEAKQEVDPQHGADLAKQADGAKGHTGKERTQNLKRTQKET